MQIVFRPASKKRASKSPIVTTSDPRLRIVHTHPMPHLRGSSPLPSLPDNVSPRHSELLAGHGVSVYWDLQPPNVWEWQQHDCGEIVLGLDAVPARMEWGNVSNPKMIEIAVPHIWFVPPNLAHRALWNGAGARVVLYPTRSFIASECGGDMTQGMLLPLRPCLSQHFLVAEYCEEFRQICHGGIRSTDIVNVARGTLLALHLLRHYFSRLRAPVAPTILFDPRVNRIIDHIDRHLRESITRRGLAREAKMSVPHLGKCFKAVTGLALMAYVWKRRLHAVRKLLETGQWKVSTVAAEYRFSDQSHLVRKFRREFKCTPKSVVPRRRSGQK